MATKYMTGFGIGYDDAGERTDNELILQAHKQILESATGPLPPLSFEAGKDIRARIHVVTVSADSHMPLAPAEALPEFPILRKFLFEKSVAKPPFVDPDERKALDLAMEIVSASYNLLDSTEERVEEKEFVIPEHDVVEMNALFDRAEELCEDDAQEGFLMGPAAKIRFMLIRFGVNA